MSSITVAIINHNTQELLRNCLASINMQVAAMVIVVDNASSDGSVEMVRRAFPQVQLVINDKNPGYGTAANQAMALSRAAWFLLLNSDTILAPDTLDALLAYGEQHPQAAIIGPRLANADGSLQASCYPAPTPLNIFLEESTLGRHIHHMPGVRGRYLRTWSHNQSRTVPWVLGAALAMRQRALDDVGRFDESFFMYAEEVDLCHRLRAAGWETHFMPTTTIVHLGGASTAQYRGEMTVQYFTSLDHFYRKHYSHGQRVLLHIIMKVIVLLRLGRDTVRLPFARQTAIRRQLNENLTAWWHILTGARPLSLSDK